MANKEFKTLNEQLEILKSRGLEITDEAQACLFLMRNNYYRVSGYSLTLRKHDVFSKHATFQNIIDIYEFDHELRHILLKYIESIEVALKSVYSYEFTKVYGPVGYRNNANFTDEKKHTEIMQKAEDQKKARLPHEAYLKHFITDLQQDIPLWAYVDLLTISDISFLYKISQPEIKMAVANAMGIPQKAGSILEHFMHQMTIIRNLCAHGSRLFNRLFEQRPNLNKEEFRLLIKNDRGETDNAHLYGFVIVMRRLLRNDEFQSMKLEIEALTQKYPFVNMRYYGFRDDWKTVL